MKTVRIDDLLHWAYIREKVENARPPGLDLGIIIRPRGHASSASSERIGAAVGSSSNLGFEAPRDAYAVERAVRMSGAAYQLRLFVLAYDCRPPDWIANPVIHWEIGRAEYGEWRRKSGRKQRRVTWYHVRPIGDLPAIVEEARNNYRAWARGIAKAHALLSEPGALQDHQLDQWLPPLEPWQTSVA